jgi:hypothetical protein
LFDFRLLQQYLPEADIKRNCEITADWPPGIGSPQSAAVHHVIGQQFGACIRRVHDPLADQIA